MKAIKTTQTKTAQTKTAQIKEAIRICKKCGIPAKKFDAVRFKRFCEKCGAYIGP
jgi:hypothetical protein